MFLGLWTATMAGTCRYNEYKLNLRLNTDSVNTGWWLATHDIVNFCRLPQSSPKVLKVITPRSLPTFTTITTNFFLNQKNSQTITAGHLIVEVFSVMMPKCNNHRHRRLSTTCTAVWWLGHAHLNFETCLETLEPFDFITFLTPPMTKETKFWSPRWQFITLTSQI